MGAQYINPSLNQYDYDSDGNMNYEDTSTYEYYSTENIKSESYEYGNLITTMMAPLTPSLNISMNMTKMVM